MSTTQSLPIKKKDRKTSSFFLIALPTLVIAMLNDSTVTIWAVKIVLAIYQFIMLKQFLDDYYEFN